MTVLKWLNDNNGALMVIITIVYVIATVFISLSNKKSADASQRQIETSQRQQEQNVGLQLYSMRKEIITKLMHKQYNEIFWDIPLLFNDEINDEFQKVAFKAGRIESLQKSIGQFEAELEILAGEKASNHVKQIREELKTFDDITPLQEYLVGILSHKATHTDVKKYIDEYIEHVSEVRVLETKRGIETTQLISKLRDFIKESIQ